jgi:hypothetical protein
MAITNFIPELWSAQMLLDFRAQATAAAVANRQYEGNARVGNAVTITTAVDVDIKDYAANGRTTAPDAVVDDGQKLLIDQEKNFDFLIDDIDRRQAAGSMDAYTQSAGLGIAEDADQYLLNLIVTSDGAPTSAAAPTDADGAWDVLRALRTELNKRHVPLANRVAFVNAEFASLLLGAEGKLTAVDTSGDSAGLREGTLGRILGFRIIESENLPVVDRPQVAAAYTPTLAFVSQITETEAMRDVDSFADRLRGLHVYGAKVIRPTAVATYTATA